MVWCKFLNQNNSNAVCNETRRYETHFGSYLDARRFDLQYRFQILSVVCSQIVALKLTISYCLWEFMGHTLLKSRISSNFELGRHVSVKLLESSNIEAEM